MEKVYLRRVGEISPFGYGDGGGAQFAIVKEDGTELTTHYCSSPNWARRDLMEQYHLDEVAALCPDGFEVVDALNDES